MISHLQRCHQDHGRENVDRRCSAAQVPLQPASTSHMHVASLPPQPQIPRQLEVLGATFPVSAVRVPNSRLTTPTTATITQAATLLCFHFKKWPGEATATEL